MLPKPYNKSSSQQGSFFIEQVIAPARDEACSTMEKEIWKPVLGFEGRYEVSSAGRVKSLPKKMRNLYGEWISKSRIMKPSIDPCGRLILCLRKDGNRFMFLVSKLVAEAFHGKRPLGMECCHNDGNSANNKSSNLRWDTKEKNEADKIIHGTSNRGVRNGQAKLTEADVIAILADNRIHREIAKDHHVGRRNIDRIKSGESWSWLTKAYIKDKYAPSVRQELKK